MKKQKNTYKLNGLLAMIVALSMVISGMTSFSAAASEQESPAVEITDEAVEGGSEELTDEKETDTTFYGDVNGDFSISPSDGLMALYALTGLTPFDETFQKVADVDADGNLTAEDALLIYKRSVRLISGFPAADPSVSYESAVNMEYELTADGNTVYVTSLSEQWNTVPKSVITWESDAEVVVRVFKQTDAFTEQISEQNMTGTICCYNDKEKQQAVFAGAFAAPDGSLTEYTGTVLTLVFEGEKPITVTADNGTSIEINNSQSVIIDPGQLDVEVQPYGDLDGDKSVTASDALNVLQIVVRLKTADAQTEKAADVDGDGNVSAADALLILQKVVRLIDVFPAEKLQ